MANTNCLEGLRCPNPKCKQDSKLFIVGLAEFDVTDDGAEVVGDIEWDDNSHARCPECGASGSLFQFRFDGKPKRKGHLRTKKRKTR